MYKMKGTVPQGQAWTTHRLARVLGRQSDQSPAGGLAPAHPGWSGEREIIVSGVRRIWMVAILALAPLAPASGQNLDAGKSASQIFSEVCANCHRSARELKSNAGASFLREHYTTGPDMASTMAAYLASAGNDFAGGGSAAQAPGGRRNRKRSPGPSPSPRHRPGSAARAADSGTQGVAAGAARIGQGPCGLGPGRRHGRGQAGGRATACAAPARARGLRGISLPRASSRPAVCRPSRGRCALVRTGMQTRNERQGHITGGPAWHPPPLRPAPPARSPANGWPRSPPARRRFPRSRPPPRRLRPPRRA